MEIVALNAWCLTIRLFIYFLTIFIYPKWIKFLIYGILILKNKIKFMFFDINYYFQNSDGGHFYCSAIFLDFCEARRENAGWLVTPLTVQYSFISWPSLSHQITKKRSVNLSIPPSHKKNDKYLLRTLGNEQN